MPRTETVDRYVLKTLDCLKEWKLPKVPVKKGFNLFVGSGNAFQTAKIYAGRFGGVAVDATQYSHFSKCRERFGDVIIISASGGKAAVGMAEAFRDDCILLTSSSNPPAGSLTKKTVVFPALREPPTYNTSTYASMIHALDPDENVDNIRRFIEGMKVPDLSGYPFMPVVSSDSNEPIAHMCATKIRETLGVGSIGKGMSEAVHGWFFHERKNEIVMCLNTGKFPLSGNAYRIDYPSNLGLMLASYYVVGKSQTERLSKEILENYDRVSVERGWKFGDTL